MRTLLCRIAVGALLLVMGAAAAPVAEAAKVTLEWGVLIPLRDARPVIVTLYHDSSRPSVLYLPRTTPDPAPN